MSSFSNRPMYICTNNNDTIEKLLARNYELYFESRGYYYFVAKPNEEFDADIQNNISYTYNIEIDGLWEE